MSTKLGKVLAGSVSDPKLARVLEDAVKPAPAVPDKKSPPPPRVPVAK